MKEFIPVALMFAFAAIGFVMGYATAAIDFGEKNATDDFIDIQPWM